MTINAEKTEAAAKRMKKRDSIRDRLPFDVAGSRAPFEPPPRAYRRWMRSDDSKNTQFDSVNQSLYILFFSKSGTGSALRATVNRRLRRRDKTRESDEQTAPNE
jgi:hypothetical protein